MRRALLALGAAVPLGVVVVVPCLVEARKHGNEASAIGAVARVSTSESVFREGDKEQDENLDYGMLKDLSDFTLVDSVLGSASKRGSLFKPEEFLWFSVANPSVAGTTGDRYFTTNQAGCIFVAGRALAIDGGCTLLPNRDVIPTGDAFQDVGRNPEVRTRDRRTSTFAIDVDTASYAIARRKLTEGTLPPRASIRVEEFVNAFHYDLPEPADGPFSVTLEASPSPVATTTILRVALQAKRPERRPARLTFLVDTSGSMQGPDRIVLIQRALRILVEHLKPADSVALCTYAGDVREVLPPTSIEDRATILRAIDALTTGGGTAMASGLDTAYALAERSFQRGASNRVILCTDGDTNVGPTSPDELRARIARGVERGITLTVVGVGLGNLKDSALEALADTGNGNYHYLDSEEQARRVFGTDLAATLDVVAKDVKVQLEFDPAVVETWRQVGYENRALADRDFRNDRVDAGELGAGHSVTALYELALVPGARGPLATVRARWKDPDAARDDPAAERSWSIARDAAKATLAGASLDHRFAVAVAGFAAVLRGDAAWDVARVRTCAQDACTNGDREEVLLLCSRVESLRSRP